MKELLHLARQCLGDDQLWINPDCGLKTRKSEEVRPASINMVAAARALRLRDAEEAAAASLDRPGTGLVDDRPVPSADLRPAAPCAAGDDEAALRAGAVTRPG
jgi:hypothetical protein